MATITEITVGTGGTYTTVAAFASALAAKNFVTEDLMWDVRVLENTSFNSTTLAALGADATRYCRIRPAAGQGVNDLNTTLNWAATGITLDSNLRTPCIVGLGVVIEGFRIPITLVGGGDYRAWRLNGTSDTYPNAPCGLRRNRIAVYGGGQPINFEPIAGANTRIDFTDNYVTQLQYDGGGLNWLTGKARVERNAFINLSPTKTDIYASDNANTFQDNLCVGFSANAPSRNSTPSTNFTDGTTVTGYTAATLEAMCVSTTDYRAKSGGPLIGAASASADNTLDIFGFNRGSDPDVGAAEYQVVVSVPDAPTNVVATAGTASASVSFAAPANDGGAAITGYTVMSSPGNIAASGTSSPINVTGLTNGTAYTFTVKATNSIGDSVASAPSASVTPAAVVVDTTAPTLTSAVATNGDTIVLTFSETLGAFTPSAGDFTFSGAQAGAIARSGTTITLSQFASDYAFGNVITVSYTKPATNGLRDAVGNFVDTFGPVAVTNNISSRPVLTGYTVKLYGDDPSHDFSTVDALNAYINGLTLDNTTGPVMIYCYKGMDVTGRQIGPASSDATNFVTLRPAPGLGYSDIEGDDAALQYGSVGLEITISGDRCRFRKGMEITGWRVKQTATASNQYGVLGFRSDGYSQPGSVLHFHHNRVLIQHGSPACESGEFGGHAVVTDTLFVVDAASTAKIWNATDGEHSRNTYVRLNGAAGNKAIDGSADNCVFFNCGGDPLSGNGAGNFTNTAQTTPKAGLTTVSGDFFVSSTNYRPASGSPMIGGGTASAVSTNDNNGNNRGIAPDAGAAQLVPALPLPTGTITLQSPIDGQTLRIELTTTNVPTSGKVSLTPANPANGASAIGPLAMVIGDGVASVEIDDIPAGNYLAPTVTLTNAGGTVSVSGTTAFEVMGVGNLVYDGGGVGTGGGGTPPVEDPVLPPAVTISVTMAGKRATVSGTVNLQGALDGSLTLYAVPTGGTPINLGAVTISNSGYTKVSPDLAKGTYTFQAVAVANAQTVTATSPVRRILGLTGNFTLLGS